MRGDLAETVVHSFANSPDGSFPTSGLIADAHRRLYGSTLYGGTYAENGTVFMLSPSSFGYVESVLYRFGGGASGGGPIGSLLLADGALYGVTAEGGLACFGKLECGTVFELTANNGVYVERVLYRFEGGTADGWSPQGGLARDAHGALYGATLFGGSKTCNSYGCGTVFKLTPSASGYTESVIHYFQGSDGQAPSGVPVVGARGVLYGTTLDGGPGGEGAVYSLTPGATGYAETILYSFTAKEDGDGPEGGVMADAKGDLFGTAEQAGLHGKGTVFELARNGSHYAFRTLYAFGSRKNDGVSPGSPLTANAGDLYGTTGQGGGSGCDDGTGCGTVFELVPTGPSYQERVLRRFGGRDGESPTGPLFVAADGAVYGTADAGGRVAACYNSYQEGCGVAFELH
jgi:uncharacterized repeat protein (TIGR03803 family)